MIDSRQRVDVAAVAHYPRGVHNRTLCIVGRRKGGARRAELLHQKRKLQCAEAGLEGR